MNILGVVDSASTLFRKKVRVTLIHSETGEKLATEMLDGSQLPEKFDKPTILEIDNTQWRIVKFEQLNAGSYFKFAHICLHVISPDRFESNNRYLIPTHASLSQIKITKEVPQPIKDFAVSITEDEWLQLEFLAFDSLVHVQETASIVGEVINPPGGGNNLLGYASSYKRHTIEQYQIEINYEEFLESLNTKNTGKLLLVDNSFIDGGFSIQSENYTYYGIVDNNVIRKLGILRFDCVDEELSNVLLKYNLIFVDWCSASILSL
jgi:hypothetical protein